MAITLAGRFKLAGKEALKLNVGNVIKSFTTPADDFVIDPATYRGDAFANGMWMFSNDGSPDKFFTWSCAESSLNAYKYCPPVAAIINRKAQAFANGKTWILNTSGKGKDKESTGDAANKIRNLFNKPNPLQSGQQFDSMVYMMVQLFGYAVVLIDKPFGFPAIEASGMWVLPNWMLEVYENDTLYFERDATVIKRIVMVYKNKRFELPLENIALIKDLTPCLDSVALPISRIKAIEMPINNNIGSFESRNKIIRQRGPQYVISNSGKDTVGTMPWLPAEKKEIEDTFNSRYGWMKNQSNALITSASIDVKTVGFNMQQLQLHEEGRESAISICNGLSYPPFLLGLTDATYNNQAEASRGLYMETIIPEAQSMYGQWDVIFKTSDYNISISKDYSHVSALQQDKEKAATARNVNSQALERDFKNNVITLDRYRVLQDEDPKSDAFGEMYYYQLLQAGWTFGNAVAAAPTTETQAEPLMQAV